jgi:hypothetical protein
MTSKPQRAKTKTNPPAESDLQPPPDLTSGGEPGQTEEERKEWKHELREERQEKATESAGAGARKRGAPKRGKQGN